MIIISGMEATAKQENYNLKFLVMMSFKKVKTNASHTMASYIIVDILNS